MKYSLYEGIFYKSIEKESLRNPKFLEQFASCKFFYTYGGFDNFSVAICNDNDCKIFYNEGLYKWIGDIRNLSITSTLIMTDMAYDASVYMKNIDYEKIREFIDSISSKKLQGMFMGDWIPEGESYIKSCMKMLKYFYDSAKQRKDFVWLDSVLCAILDNILNHDVEQYENEIDYYTSLAKEYKPRRIKELGRDEIPSEFQGRIYSTLNALIRKKRMYLINRYKVGDHQKSLIEY